MTQKEFDYVATLHRTREAYLRLIENMTSDKAQTYGVSISAEDFARIGDSLLAFVHSEIEGIDEKVKEL